MKLFDRVLSKLIPSSNGTEQMYQISASFLCDALDITQEIPDAVYSSVCFAMEATENSVAIISEITSDPSFTTSDAWNRKLIDYAKAHGAKLLISPTPVEDFPCILVENAILAYCRIMTAIRSEFTPKTIGITGSIGKTTSTEMVYTVLSSRFSTHRNTGSANSVRYAGTVIQKLQPNHTHYVQEIMEGPPYGSASLISGMVQPQAAIVTVVGTSHLEAFGSQERILESCLGIQDGMPEDGLLILNGDDPFQQNAKTKRPTVYYGIDNPDSDYRATNIRSRGEHLLFDLCYEGKTVEISLNCFGRHNILNALAAFAAGKWAGMKDHHIVAALSTYQTSGIRQNLVNYGGRRMFLDCYNASPESVHSSLDALSMVSLPEKGRYIGVLADILEVGDAEEEIHRTVGRIAADSCLDFLICYGNSAKYIAEEAEKYATFPVRYAGDFDALLSALQETATEDDVILFKGSHGMQLETVPDRLFGTWFHDEYERYDMKTRLVSDSDLQYRLYTDHATVTGTTSQTTEIHIPDHIEGLPVTGIDIKAFSKNNTITKLELPNTLRNIRYCAFYLSNSISRLTLPGSLRIIGVSAFSHCLGLKHVIISDGCTHLGARCFFNCKGLRHIYLPASVSYIHPEAFLRCRFLTIHGEAGSYAQQFSKQHHISFQVGAIPD